MRLFYGKALLNYLTVSHTSNQYNALSEDSSLRKVFSGAIGSRVVNQSTDHRADSITNSSSALVHTIAQAETHTQTQTCLRNHRHTDTHLNTDIQQLLSKQLLRRGVRSDAQLKPTETRFQKCSQSGKNGSKHPMLSISMAFNVISCKKVERNTQKLKIADVTM